jgi:chorismate synthase
VQDDLRTTQEIFGDLFGGLASLGARGVDGFVIAKSLARLLIQQGLINRETFIATMSQVAKEELEESDELSNFLSATFTQILEELQQRAERAKKDADSAE